VSVLDKARARFEAYAASKDDVTLQARIARWQSSKFGAPPIELMALGVSEELGELAEAFGGLTWSVGRLAHAVLKYRQKTRGVRSMEDLRALAVDALGDLMVFACGCATILRVDLWTTFEATAEEVMARGGTALPSTEP
jgi:NTP pyrophosphatase (non-canonical NTP hydrolase)